VLHSVSWLTSAVRRRGAVSRHTTAQLKHSTSRHHSTSHCQAESCNVPHIDDDVIKWI